MFSSASIRLLAPGFWLTTLTTLALRWPWATLSKTVSTSAADGRMPGAAVALREGLAAGDRGAVAEAGEALTHGYTTGFLVGAGMLLAAAVVAMAAVNTRRTQNAAADLKG